MRNCLTVCNLADRMIWYGHILYLGYGKYCLDCIYASSDIGSTFKIKNRNHPRLFIIKMWTFVFKPNNIIVQEGIRIICYFIVMFSNWWLQSSYYRWPGSWNQGRPDAASGRYRWRGVAAASKFHFLFGNRWGKMNGLRGFVLGFLEAACWCSFRGFIKLTVMYTSFVYGSD